MTGTITLQTSILECVQTDTWSTSEETVACERGIFYFRIGDLRFFHGDGSEADASKRDRGDSKRRRYSVDPASYREGE